MHTVFTAVAANDTHMRISQRDRTVPIPATITPVPGYPSKLSVFKIAASKFWQVRCWIAGRTHRRSTQTQSLRMAQSFARTFYEQLLAQQASLQNTSTTTCSVVLNDTLEVKPHMTFAAIAAQMMANEQARVERREFSRGSFKVLRNRLDAHILPRWGKPNKLIFSFHCCRANLSCKLPIHFLHSASPQLVPMQLMFHIFLLTKIFL